MQVTDITATSQLSPESRTKHARLRELTGRVVGSTFYGTMLKAMRDGPFKGKYGHGGRGEEVFSAQLHGIMAEEMGMSMKRGLGDALYNQMVKQQTLMDAASARLRE